MVINGQRYPMRLMHQPKNSHRISGQALHHGRSHLLGDARLFLFEILRMLLANFLLRKHPVRGCRKCNGTRRVTVTWVSANNFLPLSLTWHFCITHFRLIIRQWISLPIVIACTRFLLPSSGVYAIMALVILRMSFVRLPALRLRSVYQKPGLTVSTTTKGVLVAVPAMMARTARFWGELLICQL